MSCIPVAIGGVSGSGTRVLARLLRECGYYIGSDLNASVDNLWFAALFARRSALVDQRMPELVSAFLHRMEHGRPPDDISDVADIAATARFNWTREWMLERLASFCTPDPSPPARWGWKAPNTHTVVDHFLSAHARLRYIHLMRHGVDMAVSRQQMQLPIWGPVFLDRPVEQTPADSLAYWCAVHRRAKRLASRFSDRVLIVDFDQLCDRPEHVLGRILTFCGIDDTPVARLAGLVQPPDSRGRFRQHDPAQFAPEDLDYVESLGYVVR